MGTFSGNRIWMGKFDGDGNSYLPVTLSLQRMYHAAYAFLESRYISNRFVQEMTHVHGKRCRRKTSQTKLNYNSIRLANCPKSRPAGNRLLRRSSSKPTQWKCTNVSVTDACGTLVAAAERPNSIAVCKCWGFPALLWNENSRCYVCNSCYEPFRFTQSINTLLYVSR